MKKVTIDEFTKDAKALLAHSQRERVIVMKNRQPIAQLVAITNKDEEDLALEEDPAFWQMIRERRKEKTIPFEEVKKRLGLNEKKATKKKSKTGRTAAKKHAAKA
jgi:hypothetical protein